MIRRILPGVVLLSCLAFSPGHGADVLLSVDNGEFFYTTDTQATVCTAGNTNSPAGARAVRHWHVGVPFAPATAEPVGGFGCLGGPQSWTITVAPGTTATGSGRIRYTWDTNVPGGCCNDVQLHVFDERGALAWSTLTTEGPAPVLPPGFQAREHRIGFVLPPGRYTIVEDIFSGEHTAWLTRLLVEQAPSGGYGA